MARARLRDRHQDNLRRKLEVLKAEQGVEEDEGEGEAEEEKEGTESSADEPEEKEKPEEEKAESEGEGWVIFVDERG